MIRPLTLLKDKPSLPYAGIHRTPSLHPFYETTVKFWLGWCNLSVTDLDYATISMNSMHEPRAKHLLDGSILVIVIVSSVIFSDEVFDTIEQGDDTSDCSSLSRVPVCLPDRW
jgi:hypothetical protein